MVTDSFIVHMKAEYIYKDIGEDFKTKLDASHYEVERALNMGKIKKVAVLMKYELGEQIIRKICWITPKSI